MNYCTIQEAWGKDKITNCYKEYMLNANIDKFENTDIEKFDNTNVDNVKYNINYDQNNDECEKIFLHIKKCKKCHNKLKKYFKSNVNNLLYDIIEDNKDIIIIILITIFILLFINLINNITKN